MRRSIHGPGQVHGLPLVTMSKKLINDPERVVDESLAGLVSVSSGLKLLEGHRVVLRADVQELVEQEKVKAFIECVNNYEFSIYANYVTMSLCHNSIYHGS